MKLVAPVIIVGVAYNYDTDSARLAAFVARLTLSLCDDGSIAVYRPASGRMWKLDGALRARLASDCGAFFNSVGDGAGEG